MRIARFIVVRVLPEFRDGLVTATVLQSFSRRRCNTCVRMKLYAESPSPWPRRADAKPRGCDLTSNWAFGRRRVWTAAASGPCGAVVEGAPFRSPSTAYADIGG